jgi:hypothetical protein
MRLIRTSCRRPIPALRYPDIINAQSRLADETDAGPVWSLTRGAQTRRPVSWNSPQAGVVTDRVALSAGK